MPAQRKDDTIRRILDGNARWAANPASVTNLNATWEVDAFGVPPQHPCILWIGCADSRVPESVIAGGSRPGEIFVHRNIANQIHLDDDNALSVLEYGVDHLDILDVVVVGHTDCGGVAAAFDAAFPPSCSSNPKPSTPISRWIKALTKLAKSLPTPLPPRDRALLRLVEANVKAQVTNLASTDIIKEAWKKYKTGEKCAVYIHGWVYDLETRKIRDLRITRGPPGA
ncbi:carbonic anhydrase, partial [Pholiota conissans]